MTKEEFKEMRDHALPGQERIWEACADMLNCLERLCAAEANCACMMLVDCVLEQGQTISGVPTPAELFKAQLTMRDAARALLRAATRRAIAQRG
jgi:hypothetical protein